MATVNPTVVDRVSDLLSEIAEEVVLPRFRNLQAGEVEEKSPGEVVTTVDREAEAALGKPLSSFISGSRAVGEEEVCARPEVLEHLDQGWVWLIDPVDGTANFVAGRKEFVVMVALLRDGIPVACWSVAPATGQVTVAELGAGAWLNGRRVQVADDYRHAPGVLKTRFLPAEYRPAVSEAFATTYYGDGSGSAGIDYPELVKGRSAFLFYWRTLSWDHAPGTLLVSEAGGHVARLDGSPYRPADDRRGLLVAPGTEAWHEARSLFPDLPDRPPL